MSDAADFDATDRRQVNDRDKAAKAKRARAEGALAALMEHADGRLFIAGVIRGCGVWDTSADPHGGRTMLNEGRRQIGLELQADAIRLCFDRYCLMLKENPPHG